MFPDNPFLQLTLPRASRAVSRIEALIWTEIAPLEVFFAGHFAQPLVFDQAQSLTYKKIRLPYVWGKLFDQAWFRIALPKLKKNEPLYLHWNDQGEGTAYIDGMPFYGFDVAHRYCALPINTREVFIEGLCLQSAIWHPAATGLDAEGSRLSAASLYSRNELAWTCWHDFRVLYLLAIEEGKANSPLQPPKTLGIGFQPPVENVSVLYRRLLRALDDAVNALDKNGLPALQKVLQATYQSLQGQHERIRAVLTGHAHIDLVWLWPEKSAEYKAVHTFSTMNRLMDLYPEFIFGYSQPASYDAVGRISPRLIQQVKKRIQSGQWEAVGATEVESDTLIACGEALARSFIVGQNGFRRLQGRPSPVLWIPDVFGYCGSLPQIMRQTGVEYFFTTKLTWSNINPFPYSSFLWKGIDGSEVLVHVTQENGYNQVASPEELRRGARAYRQSDVHDEFLAPTGFGDGGGGVTEEICEHVRRVRTLAGLPETGWGKVEDFFRRLDLARARLPKYQGELYLEYHRGILTTHSDLKARFRAAERALQTWEAVRCTTNKTTRKKEIPEQIWRRVIFAQFHDYIPGSSIWEVYEEGLAELARIASDALEQAIAELRPKKNAAPGLFNPLPLEKIVLLDHGSRAVRLAPLSGDTLERLPEVTAAAKVTASSRRLASSLLTAEFDRQGQIVHLAFGDNAIPTHHPLASLALYPDVPHMFEAWDIDRQSLSLGETVDTTASAAEISGGDLEKTLTFKRRLGKKSSAIIRYRLDAFLPVLHLEYEIDWQEEQALLKLHFPTAFDGRMARFGAPFGSVLRSQQAGPPRDEAMFEAAASRWAVVSDDSSTAGLAVITEAKYGFSCREGNLGVSLLRSPKVTGEDPDHSRLFPSHARRGGVRQTFSDQGTHTIRLALAFHTPAQPREWQPAALAESLFTPHLALAIAPTDAGFLGLEGGESLIPSWTKPAADGRGWILRLQETLGIRGQARLHLGDGLGAFRTNLSEATENHTATDAIAFSPFEIVSLRIAPLAKSAKNRKNSG